jgi:ABC-type sugar transport system ATPase subunit
MLILLFGAEIKLIKTRAKTRSSCGGSGVDALRATGISKRFDSMPVLQDVSFAAPTGKVIAICGENGAGKSTLMKILSGALQPDSGTIQLDGSQIELQSPDQAIRLGIRTVYQELSLLPHLSVAENLFLGRMPHRRVSWFVDWRTAKETARRALAEFGLDALDPDAATSSLSVSLQQLIEIAKALIESPKILILDEPTAVLSAHETANLFAKVRQLTAAGTTVLYISHRLEEIFEICDGVVVLRDGAVVLDSAISETDRERIIRAMVGRALSSIYPARRMAAGIPALACRDLGKRGVFEHVSFELRAGEIVGMFGLVGSGRTDVAKAIFGAACADAGVITIDGRHIEIASPGDAIRHGIALMTEDRKRDGLALELSAIANGGLASMRSVSRHGILDRAAEARMVTTKLDLLAVRPREPLRKARQFSGGNQQKIVMAKWLLVPKVRCLILDEPTRGVDIATKFEIYRIMAELAEDGMAILLISSEMPEVIGMSDRVIVMQGGRIAAELTRDELSMEVLFAYAAGVTTEQRAA